MTCVFYRNVYEIHVKAGQMATHHSSDQDGSGNVNHSINAGITIFFLTELAPTPVTGMEWGSIITSC